MNKFTRWVLGEDCEIKLKAILAEQERLSKSNNGKSNPPQCSGSVAETSDHIESPCRSKQPELYDLAKAVAMPLFEMTPPGITPLHRFDMRMEAASFSKAKFELYKSYQIAVHHDPPAKVTESGFKRFLCDTPLNPVAMHLEAPSHGMLEPTFQSVHQLYIIDGQLVALAVLDVLPNCLSSVYFVYDPNFQHLSLGKVSAMYEANLARTISISSVNAHDHQPGGYYLGYYVPNCTKMKYKGEYYPSTILDPERDQNGDRTWYPLEQFEQSWKDNSDGHQRKSTDYYKSFNTPPVQNETSAHRSSIDNSGTEHADRLPDSFPGLARLPEAEALRELLSWQLVLHNGELGNAVSSRPWQRQKRRLEREVKELMMSMTPAIVVAAIIAFA